MTNEEIIEHHEKLIAQLRENLGFVQETKFTTTVASPDDVKEATDRIIAMYEKLIEDRRKALFGSS